jgi:hypothetical protein
MMVETGVVVNSGPLSFPRRECGPDLNLVCPPYPVPEVGVSHFYNDLWRLGGRKAIVVTNSCELLLFGHICMQTIAPQRHDGIIIISCFP